MPGSMPPNSKSLWEEGAVFESFLLVRDGKFAEDEVTRIMLEVDLIRVSREFFCCLDWIRELASVMLLDVSILATAKDIQPT
jgi:hypothetical protein